MSSIIQIPNGAILNVYLPKKKGSIKRWIMNLEARVIKKKYDFTKLLNHTAMVELTRAKTVLIWEAAVIGGVKPTELSLYSKDAMFYITYGDNQDNEIALDRIKAQSGKGYDVKSWGVYLKYLFTGKWKGGTSYEEYSKKWYCSELVDEAWSITQKPWYSTPNHVYRETSHNLLWKGNCVEFTNQLKNGGLKID